MERIADDHLGGGERRIEPIERGLAFLKVMQIHPAARYAIDTDDHTGGAPIGFLYARFEKDHTPKLSDDVPFALELIDGCRRKIHRFAPRGDGREQIPIGLRDRNHMVEAWVFAVGKLGEPIIGTLPRMRRNDVVDHNRVVSSSGAAHRNEVFFRPECRINLEAHAVEVAVDRGRVVAAANAARALHRPGMHAQDANRR